MTTDHYPSRVADAPRLTNRKEPVVHGRWHAGAPLTERQTRLYEKRGFLALENVFDAEEVGILNEEARRMRSARCEELEEGTAITEPGSAALRSVFRIHEQNLVFARLAADARLAAVARFLLDDDIYMHQSRLNYKPGFSGKEFFWHSDFETWHVEDGMPRMRALSMSVLLSENTLFNGPLMLIPGSHKVFVACVGETPDEHYKKSLKKQEYGVPDAGSLTTLAADQGIAAPTGAPGSVVIFDCNTMHGSNSNISPFPRANAYFVYNAVSNALRAPYGPARPRPDFIAARRAPATIEPARGRLDALAA